MMLIRHASWIRMKDASSLVVPVFRRTFTCPGKDRTASGPKAQKSERHAGYGSWKDPLFLEIYRKRNPV